MPIADIEKRRAHNRRYLRRKRNPPECKYDGCKLKVYKDSDYCMFHQEEEERELDMIAEKMLEKLR